MLDDILLEPSFIIHSEQYSDPEYCDEASELDKCCQYILRVFLTEHYSYPLHSKLDIKVKMVGCGSVLVDWGTPSKQVHTFRSLGGLSPILVEYGFIAGKIIEFRLHGVSAMPNEVRRNIHQFIVLNR